MENEKIAFALRDLIEYVTSGRRYESKNPYLVPEVVEGLKALCQFVGKSNADYLDGKEIFDFEMGEEGTEGQDRDNYSDDQDRENYIIGDE